MDVRKINSVESDLETLKKMPKLFFRKKKKKEKVGLFGNQDRTPVNHKSPM